MTEKCDKNKKVAHKAIGECVTDVPTTFDVFHHLLLNRCMATWNLFVYKKKQTTVYVKSELINTTQVWNKEKI